MYSLAVYITSKGFWSIDGYCLEELSQVRGQGQKPGGPHARKAVAKRSYPRLKSWAAPRVPGCDGAGTAERSFPASEVRRGGREETPSVWGQGRRREELLCIRGQGRRREESPCVRGQGRQPGGATPTPPHLIPGAAAGRSNPMPEAREGGREDQPHAQGALAAQAGAGGARGAIPHWRSGKAAVRRYPSSKVRSSGCALLEQPWRDTPCPR